MRPAVFKGDKSLKEVYAMDSKLTNLGEETFYGCRALEKFTFVTLNMINPEWTDPLWGRARNYTHCDGTTIVMPSVEFNFDDMQFFECPNTEIIMTQESAYNIFGYKRETYPMEYSTVTVYQPTITLDDFGGGAFSNVYFNTDYATWIKIEDATVYTAYQDLNKVYIYRAKHQNGYYKIPKTQPLTEAEFGFINNEDGTQTLGVKWYDDEDEAFSPYYKEDNVTANSWGDDTNYIWACNDKRKPSNSAAVIIVSDKQVIPYERHTKPLEINQSTLDPDNELRITATAINLTDLNAVHAWHFNGVDDANFVRVNSGTAPAGVVVMKLSAYQGTAGNSRIEVVWVDDDATSIMGVKEYVKSLKDSDAIYNLQGVRVSATQKGQMYIQNGKKFIQK
jgi:hypothetical protein